MREGDVKKIDMSESDVDETREEKVWAETAVEKQLFEAAVLLFMQSAVLISELPHLITVTSG